MENSGIINLLKPAGMTSHDCINSMRRITGIKKIGHSGTLDPMACGVLVVCIGKATRIIEYLENDHKEYRGEMVLGIRSDTEDIWGKEVIDNRQNQSLPENIEEIKEAFKDFKGDIYQKPPGYSAVRIDGKRLYEYKREGIEIKPKKRLVTIHELDVIDYKKDQGRIMFQMSVSKGTYVRTICHDVGEKLSLGGTMSFLLRTASGIFNVKDSISFEDLREDFRKYLLPVDFPLLNFGRISMSDQQAKDFCNGMMVREKELSIDKYPSDGEDKYCMYHKDNFLGIGIKVKGRKLFKAEKVLYQ